MVEHVVENLEAKLNRLNANENAARVAATQAAETSQQARRERIAQGYAVARSIADGDDDVRREYARLLLERQIVVRDGNSFLYFCQATYGTWRPDGARVTFGGRTDLVEWLPSRSEQANYPGVFRHLYERNISPERAADYIRDYKHPTYGKGMRGIKAEDSATHGEARKGKKDKNQIVFRVPAGTVDGYHNPVVLVKDGYATILGWPSLDSNLISQIKAKELQEVKERAAFDDQEVLKTTARITALMGSREVEVRGVSGSKNAVTA